MTAIPCTETDEAHSITEYERGCCEALVMDYARFNDDQQFELAAALFHEDACFWRPLKPEQCLKGRQDILTSLQAKPADLSTWHICTNLRLIRRGPQEIEGSSYFNVYLTRSAQLADGVLPFDGQQYLGRYLDLFRYRSGQGWRIQERRGVILGVVPMPASIRV